MLFLAPILFFLTSTICGLVIPRAEMTVAAAQWTAAVQSDIDTINEGLSKLSGDIKKFDAEAISSDIVQLAGDIQTATIDVQNGPGVNDLAAMTIIFYVEEAMAPQVKSTTKALIKAEKKVKKAGEHKAVSRGLKVLYARLKELGVALLSKTPDDRKAEAKPVTDQILGSVRKAVKAYS